MTSTQSLRNINKTAIKVIILAVFISLSIYSTASAQNVTEIPVWTGNTNSRAVRDYNKVIKKIYAISDDNIRIIEAGSVYYEDVEYPVFALSYTPRLKPAVRVFLAGGQHGNEPATSDAIVDFFEYISAHKDLYSDIAVDAIPMINPWGWVFNSRFNGDKRDTNRDYKRFASQEARLVKNFVQGKSYDYMIDHHESSADGAFIYNYDEAMFEISNNLMDYLKAEGYGIGVHGYQKNRTLINGIRNISRRRTTYTAKNTNSVGSYWRENSIIVRFFIAEHNSYGFTMETSIRKKFKHRVECHFDVMRFMIDAFRKQHS